MNTSQPSFPLPGPRIVVVGVTGSGKTTLAQQLSQLLAVPHIELDALHWGPNWAMEDTEVFREKVGRVLSSESWVTDGNYRKARDIIWARATTLIWLDYSLPVIFWQLFHRTVRRIATREELWNGNRETIREQFFSKESLFLWAFNSYPTFRKSYPDLLAQPQYAHLQVLRFRNRRETYCWYKQLTERITAVGRVS